MAQQIFLRGDVGFEVTLANIMGAVKLYPQQEIEFIVTSYGGYVDEAWRIYDYLAKQENVSVIFKDICASATTFAFLSIPKGKRKAYKNTQFAIHLPFNSYFFEDMNVENLETESARLKQVTDEVNVAYLKHLNITDEELQSLISPDSFFNETAAMGFGMISEVIENESEEGEPQKFIFDIISAKSRIAAYFPKNKINNQNQNEMSEITEIKNELSGFKGMLEKVVNFIFPKAKALILSTEEGQQVEVEGEELKEGVKVVNDAPDGTYTCMYMEKNYTITVEGGVVTVMTEIVVEDTEPDPQDVAAIKAENEALKTKLAEAVQAKADYEAVQAEFNTVKAQLATIKSKCFDPDTNEFNFTGTFEQPKPDKKTTGKNYAEQKKAEKQNK